MHRLYEYLAVLKKEFLVVDVFERKVIVGIELELAQRAVQLLDELLAVLARIVAYEVFGVVVGNVQDLSRMSFLMPSEWSLWSLSWSVS